MKKTLLIIMFCAASYIGTAQSFNEGFRVGGGVTLAVPVSNLKGFSIGAGLDLLAQYALANSFAVTGDIGYTTIFAKDENLASFDVLPIRIGARFFPSEQFYIGAKVGVGMIVGKGSGSTTAYAVGGGFIMSPRLDVSAHYEGFSKSGVSPAYLGIRIGYFFK